MAVPMLCKVGLALLAVSLRAQAQPYRGQAATIPGTIQAELFDLGGEGVGYSDTTPSNLPKGIFRPNEAVDIDRLGDGYYVKYIRAGEFLRYTVNVTTNVDAFEFTFRIGSGANTGSFRVVSGGTGCADYTTDLSGLVSVPNTGGYNVFKDLIGSVKGDGGLAAGVSTIWLCVESMAFGLDYFTMIGGPYAGVAATVPGTIQAEFFDLGGEGVGYSDTTRGNLPKGVLRPNDGVDIEPLGDGYIVGNIRAGEFLRYTVDVKTNVDVFEFTFRIGSGTNTGSLRVVSGGTGCDDYTTDLSGLVSVPNTGGYNVFKDLIVSVKGDGGLAAGVSTIWLCVESYAFNLDYFIMIGGPYAGVAATVPGTIQAEFFDLGGEGVGYSDTTRGNLPKGVLRPYDGVDIKPLGDGYTVGSIRAGEFLRYTVNVTTNVDAFVFTFRVGSRTDTGSFRVVSGGTGCDDYKTDLSGLVSVPNTRGYSVYEDLEVFGNSGSGLVAGAAKIWLCVESFAFNIDYFSMASFAYKGIPATVPGKIEAELFDLGGEGVGYSDTTAANQPKGVLRPDEAVDIAPNGSGYNIGFTRPGEFLRYTVDVTTNVDAFMFTFRVGSGTNAGSLRVVSGGSGCDDYTTDLSGLVSVPKTGGYNVYKDVKVFGNSNSGLAAGAAIIWLCVESYAFNIDYFTMTSFAYGGVPAKIPGTIEAELFDLGGEGVGYSDTTAENLPNGVLRPDEAVDIAPNGSGYNIGNIRAGEFLRYSVDVTTNVDAFLFTFRVGSGTNTGSFRVVSGGTGCDDYTTDLSGLVTVPNTGGYNVYKDLQVPGDSNSGLAAGLATIWLCIESYALNIDYFSMTSFAYGGVPATVPGTIEAELFDLGGEGVGYSDTTRGNTRGVFRPREDVDIDHLGGGYIVDYIRGGEFLRYTVDVTTNVDAFEFTFRIGSGTNTGSFRVVSGGSGCDDYTTDLSGLVSVPNTGGYNIFKDVVVSGDGNSGLAAGAATIWLCIESMAMKMDSFTMAPVQ